MSYVPGSSPIHQQCWDRACDCFATAKIFERRAQRLNAKIDFLSYLGVGVPAIFGAMVLTWGRNILDMPALMSIVGLLAIVQVGVSAASLVKKWPDELEYTNESSGANFQLSDDFKMLALTATLPSPTLTSNFSHLVSKDQFRVQQDSKKHVSDKERCWGHRHGLKQFSRACSKCSIVPMDMKPTTCSVCGDFK